MNIFYAVLLGLVQGLTEFLPVSSSGHLVLIQKIFKIDLGGADMFFDLTLHIGTLFSVCVLLRRQIISLFKPPFKKLLYLILATIPAAVAGVFLGDAIDRIFFGGAYLAGSFALTAAILTAAQSFAKRSKNICPLRLVHAGCMGLAQAIAVIPGISRSGTTVAAGIISGGNREDVAEFSFLMSIPVIAGGFVVSLYKIIRGGGVAFAVSSPYAAFCIAAGVAVSAISGFFAIKIMKKASTSARYTPFIVYLLVLAAICGTLSFAGIL